MLSDLNENKSWIDRRIKQDEIDKYLVDGKDFIPEQEIWDQLNRNQHPEKQQVRDILKKSMAIQNLTPDEVAALIHVTDPELLQEMKDAALKIKKMVYDNRIVTFAPLYLGNYCVNNCTYCGFKSVNGEAQRKVLNMDEIRKEVEILAGQIGHKRVIAVYGEHPKNDIDYIIESIKAIYSVKVPTKHGFGNIRRVNANAPAFSIEDLKKLYTVGLGTYQVFQETYHRPTYERVHPANTIKGNYQWRLYCMHRALEAGFDDVGIGVLFGLFDWKFEVMSLVHHAAELENKLGIGPHTISFPRIEPALNADLARFDKYRVSDQDFLKLILVLRLAVPFTGLIITCRESAAMKSEALYLGVTQTDASSKIDIGGYQLAAHEQEEDKQQFILGDTRTLDELIRDFAQKGHITSFCTAGYRCGRTGKCIMDLLRSGQEGKFCKLNAVLTFKEWIDDFASEETKKVAEPLLEKEIGEIQERMPNLYPKFKELYDRIVRGERDLYI
ncbi:MAG: [FeFe] hydrogenase H-cluster radical SAM maturase HydG [Candidatus Omnitrophica bacterium]|nr:[FeFe] hydrogenase H-cluster radical SAM maturase HydG [Candidatus Omnitrophota bacterium]